MYAQYCLVLCDPQYCSPPVPSSMEFSRQEYWSGLPFPTPGDLPNPGIDSTSPESPAMAGTFFTTAPLGNPANMAYEALGGTNDWTY